MKNQLLFFTLVLSFGLSAQSTLVNITTNSSSKDAVVETYAPNLNGGNESVVFVSAWTNGGNTNNKRYFIEFDLSSIPAGATIDSAKLNLYKGTTTLMSNQHQGSNSFSLRRVTQSWSENTINWNNQPSSTQVNKTVVPATTNPYQDFLNLDVTQLVADAITFGNYGFVAQQEVEVAYRAVILASSDNSSASKRPHLKVWYTNCVAQADFSFAQGSGNTVNFTNSSTSSGANTNYLWDFGDGTFSNVINPVKTFNQAGNYTVCLTIQNDCDTNTICKTVNLCQPAQGSFIYSKSGKQVQFQAQPANALSYWWSFDDGNFSNLQNPTYTYSNTGTYNVCLAITDSCGTDTVCNLVVLDDMSIFSYQKSALKIYPNPTNGKFHIDFNTKEDRDITILDLKGSVVFKTQAKEESISIDLNQPAGIYMLQIASKNNVEYHKVEIAD